MDIAIGFVGYGEGDGGGGVGELADRADGIAEGFVGLGEDDGGGGVGELADGAKGVGEVITPGAVFFGNAAVAVQVGVAASGEDLGEAVVNVRGAGAFCIIRYASLLVSRYFINCVYWSG